MRVGGSNHIRVTVIASAIAVLAALAGACASGPTSPPPAAASTTPPAPPPPPGVGPQEPVPLPPDPLDVSPSAEAFTRAPKLPAKIAKSPYAYFRFVNGPFSTVVCSELADFGGSAPVVPLHGDAHLEQYALTDIGRGLTDFDDAATGPAIVDLARMATSLVIAARMRGFAEERAVSAFLDGYRAGLRGEDVAAPSVVATLRTRFKNAPAEFLAGAEKLMVAEDADATLVGPEMRDTVAALEKEILSRRKDLPARFFTVKKIGTFKAGIGSALERKFLVRLEGFTAKAEDDRIVEVKFVGERTRPSCIRSRYEFDPRYLRDDIPPGALDRFIDPTFIEAKSAWAQEWYPNFQEVAVTELVSDAALAEVARDAGALMARDHVRGASPQNLAIDPAQQARLLSASQGLAKRVEASWSRFKAALPSPPPEPKRE